MTATPCCSTLPMDDVKIATKEPCPGIFYFMCRRGFAMKVVADYGFTSHNSKPQTRAPKAAFSKNQWHGGLSSLSTTTITVCLSGAITDMEAGCECLDHCFNPHIGFPTSWVSIQGCF